MKGRDRGRWRVNYKAKSRVVYDIFNIEKAGKSMTVPHENLYREGSGKGGDGVMSVAINAIAHCQHQQIAQEPVSHHILRTYYKGSESTQSMAPT